MTLTVEFDLYSVKMNHSESYISGS